MLSSTPLAPLMVGSRVGLKCCNRQAKQKTRHKYILSHAYADVLPVVRTPGSMSRQLALWLHGQGALAWPADETTACRASASARARARSSQRPAGDISPVVLELRGRLQPRAGKVQTRAIERVRRKT
ncbi:unnamed protein product [Prorocentrum cordatum]|uniref:Uncharacterized protein n=1 Tax=Prorocentrum cordatum TaxID=2364126 RepID=A0ABN9WPC0_9DINO|nr:unnamed protein product [Polarella glacialis]